MKNIFLKLCFLLCFFTSTMYGRPTDSLSLEIKNLRAIGVILKKYGKDTVTFTGSQVNLNTNSNPWIFKIFTRENVFVVIGNTEGEGRLFDTIRDFSKPFIVKDNAIVSESFLLQQNITIEVFNNATVTSIKKFQLHYSQSLNNITDATNPGTSDNAGGSPDTYKAGSMVNDATALSNSNTPIGTKMLILKFYANGSDFKTAFGDNKFLAPLIKTMGVAANANINLSSISSAVGGLDVTNLADGLAKFIVKRAKQELSIDFFKKFKEDIAKYKDLKTVFPATNDILMAIDHEIYNYSNYIKNLREAFRTDLKNIDENLPHIIDNHTFFDSSGYFELGLALRTGCYVSSSLKSDMHPGDILDAYPLSFFNNAPDADKPKLNILKGSIQSLQLLSESLKESDTLTHAYWVGMDKIRQVVSDKNALKTYLGLLLHVAHNKYEDVKFSTKINLYDQLNTIENVTAIDKSLETYAAYKRYILDFGSKVNEVTKMIKEYEKPATDSARIEQYAKYFKSSVQLIEYCVQVSKLPFLGENDDLKKLDQQTKKYFEIADEVTGIVTAINQKNYPGAGNHVVALYRKIVVDPARDPTASRVAALLVKYASFMANLVNAKSSDEVASAIEDAALPVGSSSIKRETPFNVSLNAYAGFFVGHEYINKINDKHGINSYGATAPVGVAISWGKKCGWSSSLFISLIDLGAVAAYRVNNDSIAQVPTIKLKDIFSPGAFLSIGLPKTPISFNLGAQFGPNLRKVTDAKNDYSNKTYVRFSASICVDVPILNLYTKPKK